MPHTNTIDVTIEGATLSVHYEYEPETPNTRDEQGESSKVWVLNIYHGIGYKKVEVTTLMGELGWNDEIEDQIEAHERGDMDAEHDD